MDRRIPRKPPTGDNYPPTPPDSRKVSRSSFDQSTPAQQSLPRRFTNSIPLVEDPEDHFPTPLTDIHQAQLRHELAHQAQFDALQSQRQISRKPLPGRSTSSSYSPHPRPVRSLPSPAPSRPRTRYPSIDERSWQQVEQAAWISNNIKGHTYGKLTVKGKAKVVQGNAGTKDSPTWMMKSHKYGPVEIEGGDDDESLVVPEVVQGDVPYEMLLAYLRGEITKEELEHYGETPDDYYD